MIIVLIGNGKLRQSLFVRALTKQGRALLQFVAA